MAHLLASEKKARTKKAPSSSVKRAQTLRARAQSSASKDKMVAARCPRLRSVHQVPMPRVALSRLELPSQEATRRRRLPLHLRYPLPRVPRRRNRPSLNLSSLPPMLPPKLSRTSLAPRSTSPTPRLRSPNQTSRLWLPASSLSKPNDML